MREMWKRPTTTQILHAVKLATIRCTTTNNISRTKGRRDRYPLFTFAHKGKQKRFHEICSPAFDVHGSNTSLPTRRFIGSPNLVKISILSLKIKSPVKIRFTQPLRARLTPCIALRCINRAVHLPRAERTVPFRDVRRSSFVPSRHVRAWHGMNPVHRVLLQAANSNENEG